MEKNNQLRKLRDRDFMQACRQVMDSARHPLTAAQVAALAAASPAPGYYVTYDYALRRINEMRRGCSTEVGLRRQPAGVRRITELSERMERMIARHGICASEALQRVLADGHASSFFLSPSSARRRYQKLAAEARRSRFQNQQTLTSLP